MIESSVSRQPKVTLVNWIRFPLETLWILWQASKTAGDVALSVEWVRDHVPESDLLDLFWKVLNQRIPVGESLHFIFMMENVSISWREQMVRHRIGTKPGDNIGADLFVVDDIPGKSSQWSQSMRIQDMALFADSGAYRVPSTLAGKVVDDAGEGVDATQFFHETMAAIARAYKALVVAGVPMEDARELIPLGAQHRISWTVNLQALLHILGERGCWILQLGIWGPIITQMVNEMAEKVHPMFRQLLRPPCISGDDKFTACRFQLENARRLLPPEGGAPPDDHPPCPLWLCRDGVGQMVPVTRLTTKLRGSGVETVRRAHLALGVGMWETRDDEGLINRLPELRSRAVEYGKLWGHDPYTWVKPEKVCQCNDVEHGCE